MSDFARTGFEVRPGGEPERRALLDLKRLISRGEAAVEELEARVAALEALSAGFSLVAGSVTGVGDWSVNTSAMYRSGAFGLFYVAFDRINSNKTYGVNGDMVNEQVASFPVGFQGSMAQIQSVASGAGGPTTSGVYDPSDGSLTITATALPSPWIVGQRGSLGGMVALDEVP